MLLSFILICQLCWNCAVQWIWCNHATFAQGKTGHVAASYIKTDTREYTMQCLHDRLMTLAEHEYSNATCM